MEPEARMNPRILLPESTEDRWLKMGRVLEKMGHVELWEMSKKIPGMDERVEFLEPKCRALIDAARMATVYERKPVGVKEFVESPDFLNRPDELYPRVMEELVEINSGKYVETVLTGGIGSGKTTVANYTQVYQLYRLSCMHCPQTTFGIGRTDEILIVFQSISKNLAKSVDYERFKQIVADAPYFQKMFPFDSGVESELKFPKRLIVRPLSGATTAALGSNVIGGNLDEVNFMAVVQNSKASRDGGEFKQAWELYHAIVRRRESRFMRQGTVPGMLCLISSKQYPDDFTEIKAREAKTNPRIYVYDKRIWDVAPERFTSGTFPVFLGDQSRKPRILGSNDKLSEADKSLVMDVPNEYRTSFETDLLSSLRDIAGASTLALHPFFLDTDKVAKSFGRVRSIVSREECDFVDTTIRVAPRKAESPHLPRFVHIDLGVRNDSAGVACGFVRRFVPFQRGVREKEFYPEIVFDFVLRVKPPQDGEVKFDKIRELLYVLREQNLNLKWVTLDTYQSYDFVQILNTRGIESWHQSLDSSVIPYEMAKTAFMQGRVLLPEHDKASEEITRIEYDAVKRKVDHPPDGSKDCADAIAGVIHGLTLRRENWALHNQAMTAIPESVQHAARAMRTEF